MPVKIIGHSVYHTEQAVFKLFAKDILSKYQASYLLNKLSKMLNNATEELESVVNELNQMVANN